MTFWSSLLGLFRRNGVGSGRTMYSAGRRNSIRVNISTASDLFDIYSKYGIILSIVNNITRGIQNTPIWITKNERVLATRKTDQFRRLCKRPNRKAQAFSFLSSVAFELLVYGRCYIAKKEYAGIGEDEFYLLRNLSIYQIEYDNFGKLKKVVVREGGNLTEYSNVVELNYFGECKTEGEAYNSLRHPKDDFVCPIVALRTEIETYANMIDALDNSYGDGGARKIISFKNGDGSYTYAHDMLPDEEKAIKDQLRDDYGRNSNDNKYIISKNEVGVHDLSLPTNQLDYPNSKQALEVSICNAFNFPAQLIGVKTGAYKSQTEAERAFYTRCVSPLANFIFANLDDIFGTGIVDNGGEIELDYSRYVFFQEGKKTKGAAIQTFAQGIGTLLDRGLLTEDEAKVELYDIL